MKFMLVLLAACYVVLAKPSLPVNPGGIGGLFKGPNSETIIKGPDGSVITSAAEGGEVKTKLEPIVVAEIAPPAPISAVSPHTPILIETAPLITASPTTLIGNPLGLTASAVPIALSEASTVLAAPAQTLLGIKPVEAAVVDAPDVEPDQSSDLVGPSGRVSTKGSHAIIDGPASTTVTAHAPKVVAARPVLPVSVATVTGPPALSLAPSSSISLTPLIPPPLPINTISAITAVPDIHLLFATPIGRDIGSVPQFPTATISSIDSIPSVQPAAENGVLNSPGISSTISSSVEVSAAVSSTQSPSLLSISPTISPQLISLSQPQPSTLSPPIASTLLPNYLNKDLAPQLAPIGQQPTLQLTVNPDSIPRQNIVPPEIGLRQGIDGKLLFSPAPRTRPPNTSTPAPSIISTLPPQYVSSPESEQIVINPGIDSLTQQVPGIQPGPDLLQTSNPEQSVVIQNVNVPTDPRLLEQGLLRNEVQTTKLLPGSPSYVEVTPKPAQPISAPQYVLAYPQSEQRSSLQPVDASQLLLAYPQDQPSQPPQLSQLPQALPGAESQDISPNIQNHHLLTQAGVDIGDPLSGSPAALAEPSYALNLEYSGGLGRWGRGANNKKKSN